MKTIVRSHTIAAALSLLLLLATIGALFIFVGRINARVQRVLDTRDRLASYEQNKRKLSEETEELEVIRANVADLEKYIITEDTASTLLSSIEAIATKHNIEFTLTSVVATSATGKEPAKLHIDFSADGSFANIQEFISDVLAQPYQVEMTRMSLYLSNGAAVQSGGSWQLLAGIDVISF